MPQSRDSGRRVSATRRLIEREFVGQCLHCRLRVGDTPTTGCTSVKDSDGGHSHQRGRDSERGTFSQWRISTACKLIERESIGRCLHCHLEMGDTPAFGHTSIWGSDGGHSISRVAWKWLGEKMHFYFMI